MGGRLRGFEFMVLNLLVWFLQGSWTASCLIDSAVEVQCLVYDGSVDEYD